MLPIASRRALLSASEFSPRDLPNLAAWFRYGVAITAAGGFVSKWADQSGNARDANQATGSAQPALNADGSILFDGVDDFLKCSAFTLVQPETVYLLTKQVGWTSGDLLIDGNATGSALVVQRTGSPQIGLNAGTSIGNVSLALGSYGVLAAVINGASSSIQLNNGTPVTGNAGAGNMGGFTLGASGAGTSFWGNVEFKEAIIYGAAHDADTRARLIRYLAKVGGLSV